MKLYEIAQGEQIQIIASTEKGTFEHMTSVELCKEGVLLVQPIHYEGKLLNFSGESLKISVLYVLDGEKPMIWEGCTIRYLQTKTQKFHAIICKRDGARLNRRHAFRQYLGTKGSLFIESTRERKQVLVKNISTTGVSFIMESTDLSAKEIGAFSLEFEDTKNRLNIQLHGRVVREEEIEGNRKVFGAAVSKSNMDLSTYIALKQKQDIAKKMGNEK